MSAQSETTHDKRCCGPKINLRRDYVTLPPPFAIQHVSRLVPSLILQWLRIIVPPVAGFNYSHDAKAQAVAAITSSITKNYGSANLQMHYQSTGCVVCGNVCVCHI